MDSKDEFIPLAQWPKYKKFPSHGTMRSICAERDQNGATEFLINMNGRFYVNMEKFQKWIDAKYVKEGEKFGRFGKMEKNEA